MADMYIVLYGAGVGESEWGSHRAFRSNEEATKFMNAILQYMRSEGYSKAWSFIDVEDFSDADVLIKNIKEVCGIDV